MNLQSFAWRTDIELIGDDCQVINREQYLVVRSNKYPHHLWKNFLLYQSPAQSTDVATMLDQYENEFPGRKDSIAVAFGWDADSDELAVKAELELQRFSVTQYSEFFAPSEVILDHSAILEVRVVEGEELWREIIERRISVFCHGRFRDLQAEFEKEKFVRYRQLSASGSGHWYIAFLNGIPIGDLGIFVLNGKIARFQEVLVYPEFRNRGLGREFVRLCCYMLTKNEINIRFLAVAEEGGPGHRVYKSIGFQRGSTQIMASRTIYS